MEEKGKFVNFLYVNKKKIGAVITTAALVAGIALTAKSCTTEAYDAETVDSIEYFDDSFKMPNVQLGDNSNKNTDEIIEVEDVNKRNSLLNNKLGYVNGNVFGGTRPWGNTGGNKPSEPEKPVEPGKPSEPEKPSEPSKPTEPEKPSEPSKPSEPEKPTEPSRPVG